MNPNVRIEQELNDRLREVGKLTGHSVTKLVDAVCRELCDQVLRPEEPEPFQIVIQARQKAGPLTKQAIAEKVKYDPQFRQALTEYLKEQVAEGEGYKAVPILSTLSKPGSVSKTPRDGGKSR